MNSNISEVIARIVREYPNLLNSRQRLDALLSDLAPEMPRERILARSFFEMGGYDAFLTTDNYLLEEKKQLDKMTEMFSMEEKAALWIIRIFGEIMGHVSADEPRKERVLKGSLLGQVAIGKKHVVAVAADGTVFAGGDNSAFQCDVANWRDIIAVAAGDAHTLGLRADGTVLATGSNAYDECDVGEFSNVKAIYANGYDTVCVFEDGTAKAIGRSKTDLSTFTDIASVTRYPEGLIGIKSDGTLQLAASIADDDAAAEIAWLLSCHDVKQVISTYNSGVVIRGSDNCIYKSNQNANYFAQWKDITSIADCADCFAVLRGDGTVRVLAYNREDPRPDTAAEQWANIAAIFGGYRRLIGLTADGNLLTAYTHQGWLWGNQAMLMDYASKWYPVGVCE